MSNVLCLAAICKFFLLFCWLQWQARRNVQNWAKSLQEPLPHQSSSLGYSTLGDVSRSSRHPGHTACRPWGRPSPAAYTYPESNIEQTPVSHILSISARSDPLPKHCAPENGHFSHYKNSFGVLQCCCYTVKEKSQWLCISKHSLK